MEFLGFIVGVSFIAKIFKGKKKIDSFYKGLGKIILNISTLVVEISEIIAKGVILVYKGTKYFYRVLIPIHLRRKVLLSVYGEEKNVTIINPRKYKSIKAYEYYPNPLTKTPREKLS